MAKKSKKEANVPNLRFPGFHHTWEERRLGDIASFSKGKGISKADIVEDGTTECIRYGELYTYYHEVITEIKSRTGIAPSNLVLSEENDVIIPASGETQLDIATASCVNKSGVALGGDLNIIKSSANGVFLSYYLNSKKKVEIANLSQGISVVHLYAKQLATLNINIPDRPEQDKIALFLTKLDERIQTQNKIIEDLKCLISATISTIEKQSKKKSGWKKVFLYEVLTERTEKNEANYPVHSVSVSVGVVNQIEYLGRSFAAKNTGHYNVVHEGDLVYTKSPTGEFPYGIIKQSFVEQKVSVSPLYGVYKPVNRWIGNILHYYFLSPINTNNYLHSLIQKGAKNTINISNQGFLMKQLYLPINETECRKMAQLLNSITQKLTIEKMILDKYNAQKKHMLKELFI